MFELTKGIIEEVVSWSTRKVLARARDDTNAFLPSLEEVDDDEEKKMNRILTVVVAVVDHLDYLLTIVAVAVVSMNHTKQNDKLT